MSFDGFNDIVSYNLKIGDIDFSEFLPPEVIKNCLEDTLVYAKELVQENFKNRQGDWEPLKPATIKQRLRLGYSAAPILIRSGTLFKNVAAGHDVSLDGQLARGSIFPIPATTPYSKTSIEEYAEALDKVRPFYDLDDNQTEKVKAFFQERLFQELGIF